MNSNGYYIVYIAFCLYHNRKKRYVVDYTHNIEHAQVELFSDDAWRTRADALATEQILEGVRALPLLFFALLTPSSSKGSILGSEFHIRGERYLVFSTRAYKRNYIGICICVYLIEYM